MKENKVLGWFIIACALLLAPKTAQVLSYYAPKWLSDVTGFDVSLIFGIVSTVIVEGLILVLHFHPSAKDSAEAQIVKWITIGISGSCQIFSAYITTGNEAQMSDTLKAILIWGVPEIPLICMILLAWIGVLPETGQRKPWRGLKHSLDGLQTFWHGEGYQKPAQPETQVLAKDTDQPQLQSVGKNGQGPKNSRKGKVN